MFFGAPTVSRAMSGHNSTPNIELCERGDRRWFQADLASHASAESKDELNCSNDNKLDFSSMYRKSSSSMEQQASNNTEYSFDSRANDGRRHDSKCYNSHETNDKKHEGDLSDVPANLRLDHAIDLEFSEVNEMFRWPTEIRLCSVCSDVAAGFHCGEYVCEACKVRHLLISE